MKKSKNILKANISIIAIVLLTYWTIVNLRIANEAKIIEESNTLVLYPYDEGNKVPEDVNPVALITERFTPVSVIKNDEEWQVAFDQTYFGTLELLFNKPTEVDQNISLTLSEADSNGHAWTRHDSDGSRAGFGISYYNSEVIIPSGVTEYRIVLPERPLPINDSIVGGWTGGVLPFYIVTISGLSCNEDEVEFNQVAVHTEFNDNSSLFVSNDVLLNEIYDFCKRTIKSTTYAGVYVDGFRELRPYEADAFINELGHFSVDNNYEIDRTTIEYLIKHHTWPTEWILQTIPIVYEYYMYSGDKEIIEKIYPELERCLISELLNKDGLIDSTKASEALIASFGVSAINDIIDWPESERNGFDCTNKRTRESVVKEWGYRYKSFISAISGCQYASTLYRINADGEKYSNAVLKSPNAVVNAFYYQALREMAFLSGELGMEEKQAQYTSEADSFKTLFQSKFIDVEKGLVVDSENSSHSSLHANMFALNFDLVPEHYIDTVVSFIKTKGMACSVYGSQYLIETLFKYNEDDYALSLLTSKNKRSWYNMIYNTGSKLTTEAWDESVKPNMDWNHPWGTAPVNIITRYIVGIKPFSAGCETIMFAPHFGDLDNIKTRVPITNGQVDIRYSKSGKTINIDLDTPRRTIFIPPEGSQNVVLNGEIINEMEIWLEAGKNSISYENR